MFPIEVGANCNTMVATCNCSCDSSVAVRCLSTQPFAQDFITFSIPESFMSYIIQIIFNLFFYTQIWKLEVKSDNLESVFTGIYDETNRCFLFNISNNERHFHYAGHVTSCTTTTHPCKRVCPHTALVRVTLVLAGVQVYAGHVLSALYNKEEAQFTQLYYSTNKKTK